MGKTYARRHDNVCRIAGGMLRRMFEFFVICGKMELLRALSPEFFRVAIAFPTLVVFWGAVGTAAFALIDGEAIALGPAIVALTAAVPVAWRHSRVYLPNRGRR